MKSWSQNLGHEGMLTTLTSYGTISLEAQGQLIAESSSPEHDEIEKALQIVRMLREQRKS